VAGERFSVARSGSPGSALGHAVAAAEQERCSSAAHGRAPPLGRKSHGRLAPRSSAARPWACSPLRHPAASTPRASSWGEPGAPTHSQHLPRGRREPSVPSTPARLRGAPSAPQPRAWAGDERSGHGEEKQAAAGVFQGAMPGVMNARTAPRAAVALRAACTQGLLCHHPKPFAAPAGRKRRLQRGSGPPSVSRLFPLTGAFLPRSLEKPCGRCLGRKRPRTHPRRAGGTTAWITSAWVPSLEAQPPARGQGEGCQQHAGPASGQHE